MMMMMIVFCVTSSGLKFTPVEDRCSGSIDLFHKFGQFLLDIDGVEANN